MSIQCDSPERLSMFHHRAVAAAVTRRFDASAVQRAIWDILVWSSTRTYEIHVGIGAIMAGLWILLWMDLRMAPPWQPLISLVGGDPSRIGWGLLIAGVLSVHSVMDSHTLYRSRVQFALCLIWAACAASSVVSGYAGLATPIYSMMALSTGWTSIRLAVIRA